MLLDFYICSQVFYDKSLKTKLGSHKAVKSFYDSAHVHLQAAFCHVSLGTKIKLERLGEVSEYKPKNGKKLLANDQGMFTILFRSTQIQLYYYFFQTMSRLLPSYELNYIRA